jgi:hypothetical protein
MYNASEKSEQGTVVSETITVKHNYKLRYEVKVLARNIW